MGYAGRMLAKHDPWLYFGLWAVLVVLLNFSVVCGILQGQPSLWISIPVLFISVASSLLILASFFVGAKQQSYLNWYKEDLKLSNTEKWLLHAGALTVTMLVGVAALFAVCMMLWWLISLFI